MLDKNAEIIGENIRKKAPSAELGPNQLDTDSLPPYSILDNILKGIIEEKKDLKQLEEDGYKKELILKIISLIKKAEFKRKQAPPILKLSSQSLGSDWRVPIAISYWSLLEISWIFFKGLLIDLRLIPFLIARIMPAASK